jgi:hypothetical protein
MDFRGFSKHINYLIFRQLKMKILKIRKIQTSYIFKQEQIRPEQLPTIRPVQDRPQAQNHPQATVRSRTDTGAQPSAGNRPTVQLQ